MTYNRKNIMKRAWELKKDGYFEGTEKPFSECLKKAWAEAKIFSNKEFKGSAKQIAWAKDIMTGYAKTVKALCLSDDVQNRPEEIKQAGFAAMKTTFDNMVEQGAAFVIEFFADRTNEYSMNSFMVGIKRAMNEKRIDLRTAA